MPFELYRDVVLIRDVAAEGLKAGDVGTVVEYHPMPDGEDGYSVEFFDMTGRTVLVATLPAGALRLPTTSDRPAIRSLAS